MAASSERNITREIIIIIMIIFVFGLEKKTEKPEFPKIFSIFDTFSDFITFHESAIFCSTFLSIILIQIPFFSGGCVSASERLCCSVLAVARLVLLIQPVS